MLSLRDKRRHLTRGDPPIEIGGYKYVVPNGTARKSLKICVDTGNFGEVILRGLRAVSRYARKTPYKEIYWGDAVFDRKIFDFSIKNSVAPVDFLKGVFRA